MRRLFNSALMMIVSLVLAAGCASPGSGGTDPAASTSASQNKRAKARQAPRSVQEQYEKALVLMQVEDFVGAERAFTLFLQAHPKYAGPYVNLGIIYARTDRLNEAAAAFKNAIDRNRSNAVALNELGIVYRRMGRFSEAKEAYNRAVEVAPEFAAPHLNLGVLYDLYLRQPDVALEHYERYQGLDHVTDELVAKWIAELKMRIGSEQRTAGVAE